MCMTLFSPPATMATPCEGAPRHQGFDLNGVEGTEDRKQVLRMTWVLDTDEQGIHRLCMRWTVTPPPKSGKTTRPRLKPAVCRGRNPTAEQRIRVAIPLICRG
jgi:hypothetical protein